MLRHLLNIASLLVLFLNIGCASMSGSNKDAVQIYEVDRSLSEIRSLIANILPAGQRTISPNGREIQSRHFLIDRKGEYQPAGDALARYFAHLVILGDRRPYTIEILVTAEKRVKRDQHYTYIVTGYDRRLAKELEKKLLAELTKRREDLNIIDDFRVY